MSKNTKLIYKILNQVLSDLDDKIENDFDNVVATSSGIEWEVTREVALSKKEKEVTKKIEGDDRETKTVTAKMLVIKFISIYEDDRKESNMKKLYYLNIIANHNGKEEEVCLDLRWYDHFRPTILKAKRLVDKAYSLQKARDMVELDKKLALINSNRIDDILFGDKNEHEKD